MKKTKIEKMLEEHVPVKKEKRIYEYKGFKFSNPLSYFIGIILYWLAELICKIESIYYNNIKWNEEKTIKILDYIVLNYFFKDKKNKKLSSFIIPERKRWEYQVKRRYRAYCKKYNKEINNYLINNYKLEGLTKEVVLYCDEFDYQEYKIIFALK